MNSDDEFAQMRQNADLKEYYEMTGSDYTAADTPDYRALAQQLAQALDDLVKRAIEQHDLVIYVDDSFEPDTSIPTDIHERIVPLLYAARKAGLLTK